MISKTIYKAPGGKMIRIAVDHTDNKIQNITITGDFFLYPEETLEEMEKELRGLPINEGRILLRLKEIVKRHKITFVGIDEKILTRAIMIACGVGI
jgi:lipoate-protein ligase A